MTIRTLAQAEARGFTWVDVVGPTADELALVAAEYGLHATTVRDCLDPVHLPKYEKLPGGTFTIVRGYDDTERDGETLHEVTRKVAIFVGPGVIVTVHRQDQAYLQRAMEEVLETLPTGIEPPDTAVVHVVTTLMQAAVDSFLLPLERLEVALDGLEARVFEDGDFVATLRELHRLKRRAALFKRLLWHTLSTAQRLVPPSDRAAPHVQNLRETTESLFVYADELLEEANGSLEMQLSLASHRTNEVVRILTLFSAFFLPLTFIVGIYGMNFRLMPELEQAWGYPAVLALMAGIAAGIYAWFRRRGWIGR